MPVLRVECSVPDFEKWKRSFDSDPADRKGSGVRGYHILRSVDDPSYVMIDLEFDDIGKARNFLAFVQRVWEGSAREVVQNPLGRIAEPVETREL